LRYVYDSRDREVLARNGVLARLEYFRSEDALGAVAPYERLEALTSLAFTVGDDVVHLRATGGTSFDTNLPIYDIFTLGGPVSLPGVSMGELRGNEYWTAQASYMHKVVDISDTFGQAIYAGLTATAGDMHGVVDPADSDTIYSGAFVVGGLTPLGPLTMSLAVTTSGDWQVVLGLGRPVEERNIVDPNW
jgi:outer membrane protein assembly factor BamA